MVFELINHSFNQKFKTKFMKNTNIQLILLFLTVIFILSLSSCNPSRKYEKEEKAEIQEYLRNNDSIYFVLLPSGLYYLDVVLGSGRLAATHDTAYIKYTGKFLDGTVFSTNVGKSDTLISPVDEGWLISGIDEGITYMKEGGKTMLLIPSKLAYGSSGRGLIDGYTPLLFDVELVRVKPGPGK
jgi:FKBP-type peptidyl-prolyl cis-trans isomerase FkpA